MFIFRRKMMWSAIDSSGTLGSYESALKALLTLQSNTAYLQNVNKQKHQHGSCNLHDTEKYLLRSGITLDDLDKLSIIHVAGTKGKGSTCAYTESILRNHGFRTGFFSSPHLVSVRERLRINGEPVSQMQFSIYFWEVYNKLNESKQYESDMPTFFKFLTVLMFKIFLEVNVDVAVVEVGIGGEYDCTNVVRHPICVGISSLGFDHTSILGNTIEDIAFQKSGILKPGTIAFTVPQAPTAMKVLQKRAVERKCTLRVIPPFEEYTWENAPPALGQMNTVQQQNASLAIQIAKQWIKSASTNKINEVVCKEDKQNFDKAKAAIALSTCKWPGRTQILRSRTIDFFLDGAHTPESLQHCAVWFRNTSDYKTAKKILIFNVIGNRDPMQLWKPLRSLDFQKVYFVPNHAGISNVDDAANSVGVENELAKCRQNAESWGEDSVVFDSVWNALQDIKKTFATENTEMSSNRTQVLVTGSLHLVGAVLTVLDPDLTMTTNF